MMKVEDSSIFSKLYDGMNTEFRIDTFLTESDSWNSKIGKLTLENIFEREEFSVQSQLNGDARKLIGYYEDPETKEEEKVYFDAYLDSETNVLFCLSYAKQREIDKTLKKVVKKYPGIYHLWISPKSMWKIRDEVFSEHPYSKIVKFTAKKPAKLDKGKIRPEFKRTFTYWGDDGDDTLREVSYDYGSFPRTIKFEIPGTMKFSVNNLGYYRCISGKDRFSNLFYRILKIPLQDRNLIEKSSFETASVSIDGKKYEVPYLKPWSINFDTDLTFKEGKTLVDKLNKNNFSLVNSEMSEGSVILDTTVVDDKELDIFSISASEDEIVVAPQERCSSESFIRFLHIVVENIDPEAEISILEA